MLKSDISIIVPKTKEGFILCFRADKQPYPNTWCAAVGGKVDKGETPLQAALREAKEEAQLSTNLVNIGTYHHSDEDMIGHVHIFTTQQEISIASLTPDPREIRFFKTLTKEEIVHLIEAKKCAPSFNRVVDFL